MMIMLLMNLLLFGLGGLPLDLSMREKGGGFWDGEVVLLGGMIEWELVS